MRKYLLGLLAVAMLSLLAACSAHQKNTVADLSLGDKTGSMELQYASQFTVDYYGNYKLITIGNTERYLAVPKDKMVPEELTKGITVVYTPVDHIYLAASSAMDLFRQLDGLQNISFCGTDVEHWTIPEVVDAMNDQRIRYGGKYSAPDYEAILNEKCELAIESTMIYHTPDVEEQLEMMDVPVLVERSSYEPEPLGRTEWIKLYGLLIDKEEEAEQFMEECIGRYKQVEESCKNLDHKPTFCIFYISANGNVVIKKPGDYVVRLIEQAGGEYVIKHMDGVDENALSTMNMQMESFYAYAADADYLFYNSTIVGDVTDLNDLIRKNPLLADFRAVQTGNAWCVHQNMFQQTTGTAEMMEEFHLALTGKEGNTTYLSHLNEE